MLTSLLKPMWSTVLASLIVSLSFPSNAAEEVVKILAPWEADGKMYRIGPQRIQFIGEFEGIMYFEDGDGALNTALFVCPTLHELNEATEKTLASGNCHIVSAEGNVFGRFECEGTIGYCDSKFEITAGTDALEGITGGGPIKIRTALTHSMREAVSGSVVTEAAGLAIWPNLRVNIPEPPQ